MKTKLSSKLSLAITALTMFAWSGLAVDLLQRYPTPLTKGDSDSDHARVWTFSESDIFEVSSFSLKVGDGLKVETTTADVGVGHCSDGAVWAAIIPRDQGTLTSSAGQKPEAIANVWLRFHPAQIGHLFAPDDVLGNSNAALLNEIRSLANRKMLTSWQADGGRAMIPEPKDMTVFVDTKDGQHRFFVVDTDAQTAQYIAAFNRQAGSQVTASSVPPVVIKTMPESGSQNAPSGEVEVKVTFSQAMTDPGWSWCPVRADSEPKLIGQPYYEADHRTCVVKVKLEPGKTYGWWLNTEKFHGFQNTHNVSAVPYLLTFKTQ